MNIGAIFSDPIFSSQPGIQRAVAVEVKFCQQLLAPFGEAIEGLVVESTYNWYWLVDGLMDAGFDVRLAHTGAIP